MQDALLRAWRATAAVRGPQLAALVAVPDRDQQLSAPDRAPAQAGAADRLRAAERRARRSRAAARRVGLDRGLPGRRARRRLRRARRALRTARERRARVRRGAPAPSRAPARGADPPRRARLLGRGGRRDARDDARRPSTARCSARTRRVDEQLPERSQQQTLRSLGDQRVREIVERYMDAWERGDVDTIVSMLAEDAVLAMPPRPSWYRGLEAARAFLARGPLAPVRARRRPPRARERTARGRQLLLRVARAPRGSLEVAAAADARRGRPDRGDHRVRRHRARAVRRGPAARALITLRRDGSRRRRGSPEKIEPDRRRPHGTACRHHA